MPACSITAISEQHRSYLIREQLITPALINFVLNATIAWLIFGARPHIPVWGEGGLVFDTAATLFLLPSITCLIVTPLVRRAVASGKLPPTDWRCDDSPFFSRLPASVWPRSAVIGAAGLVVGMPLVLGGLTAAGIAGLSAAQVVALKGVYTAVLAASVGPIIALCALSEASAAVVPVRAS